MTCIFVETETDKDSDAAQIVSDCSHVQSRDVNGDQCQTLDLWVHQQWRLFEAFLCICD